MGSALSCRSPGKRDQSDTSTDKHECDPEGTLRALRASDRQIAADRSGRRGGLRSRRRCRRGTRLGGRRVTFRSGGHRFGCGCDLRARGRGDLGCRGGRTWLGGCRRRRCRRGRWGDRGCRRRRCRRGRWGDRGCRRRRCRRGRDDRFADEDHCEVADLLARRMRDGHGLLRWNHLIVLGSITLVRRPCLDAVGANEEPVWCCVGDRRLVFTVDVLTFTDLFGHRRGRWGDRGCRRRRCRRGRWGDRGCRRGRRWIAVHVGSRADMITGLRVLPVERSLIGVRPGSSIAVGDRRAVVDALRVNDDVTALVDDEELILIVAVGEDPSVGAGR